MKIKKLKLLTAAAFLLMCLLAFGGCGTDGEAADFNAIQWFKGSYQTDGENFGSLHCDYRDFGTEVYNAAKSTDYQTEFDNVIRTF